MAQLLDYIMSVFDGIVDWISFIFTYLNLGVTGIFRAIQLAGSMFGIVLNLPTYFTWLPAAVLTVVSQCFIVLFLVKVIHMIK